MNSENLSTDKQRFHLGGRLGGFILAAAVALSGLYFWDQRKDEALKNSDDTQAILEFRKNAEERLRGPDGWLTVVGLTWLKQGDNTIGSDEKNVIVLPKPVAENLGVITLNGEQATLKITGDGNILIDDQPATKGQTIELKDDGNGDVNIPAATPTKIKIDTVTFFLIKRKNGIGVRMRDQNSEARKNFTGRTWFAPNAHFIVDAEWVPFSEPKPMMVPDILGNVNEEKSPGYAKFTLDGQDFELHPTVDDDGTLFFVFRDQTSGKETYGAARFLNTPMPKDGRLVLDFNRAVNPPCAFTHFATCPMPPPENILKIAITAGELKPPGH
jgi:uncharacterized protein